MKQKIAAYQKLIRNNLASVFSFINLGFIQGSNALIQILIIPVVTRILGLAVFGHVMVAASYAALVSLLINYGSNQSGVKDVALHRSDPKKLSEIFYTIFFVRLALFLLSFTVILVMNAFGFPYGHYFILANAIVLGETLNPFFFFVGLQNLLTYNIVNLIAKVISAILIVLLVNSPAEGGWVNFYIGITSAAGYLLMCTIAIRRYKLDHFRIPSPVILKFLKYNLYLTGNNLSVQLQQSFFLFTVSATGNALLLGAYSLCDKIVWSSRLLIISFSNAVYPKAVALHQAGNEYWRIFKKKINLLLLAVFLCAAVMLFVFSEWLVLLITGENNELAAGYIRAVSFVPLVAALNSMNVIDLLMKDRYHYIFFIALLMLAISVSASEIFIRLNNVHWYGYYPIIVEICSLPLYLFYIRRAEQQLH